MESYIFNVDVSTTFYVFLAAAFVLSTTLVGNVYATICPMSKDEIEGCRRLGIETNSHLDDEHDERYSKPGSTKGCGWRVKSLWIYPVKSCRGVELSSNRITGKGMEYDRQFSFAQLITKSTPGMTETKGEKAEYTWRFITQRTFPAMANIKIEIWVPDSSSPKYTKAHSNIQTEGVIVLRFPCTLQYLGLRDRLAGTFRFSKMREKTVHIPFKPSATEEDICENLEIWKDSPSSLLITSTERTDPWIHALQSYLGIANHIALFRTRSEHPREVYRAAPRRDTLGYQSTIAFQDAYPLHILNLASVHDVAKKMEKGASLIGARNFRPNIIVTGGDAYAEDSWKRIKIGVHEYHVACRTVRCLLPNVDPATGVRHGSEPNRTLKNFRRIDQGDPKNACFGMQMVPAIEENRIDVDDEVIVLETGEHCYIKQ